MPDSQGQGRRRCHQRRGGRGATPSVTRPGRDSWSHLPWGSLSTRFVTSLVFVHFGLSCLLGGFPPKALFLRECFFRGRECANPLYFSETVPDSSLHGVSLCIVPTPSNFPFLHACFDFCVFLLLFFSLILACPQIDPIIT